MYVYEPVVVNVSNSIPQPNPTSHRQRNRQHRQALVARLTWTAAEKRSASNHQQAGPSIPAAHTSLGTHLSRSFAVASTAPTSRTPPARDPRPKPHPQHRLLLSVPATPLLIPLYFPPTHRKQHTSRETTSHQSAAQLSIAPSVPQAHRPTSTVDFRVTWQCLALLASTPQWHTSLYNIAALIR
jgi:hypothetical protein